MLYSGNSVAFPGPIPDDAFPPYSDPIPKLQFSWKSPSTPGSFAPFVRPRLKLGGSWGRGWLNPCSVG